VNDSSCEVMERMRVQWRTFAALPAMPRSASTAIGLDVVSRQLRYCQKKSSQENVAPFNFLSFSLIPHSGLMLPVCSFVSQGSV
jgi:hypothetical protein